MQAFICTLLVAAVAAQQPLDFLYGRGSSFPTTRYGKHDFSSLLKKDLVKDILPYQQYEYGTDMTYDRVFNGERLMTFDELVMTPLFREYMQIPLFQQWMERYPTVFQKYVESQLFQKFWTVPSFVQYWKNPVLFYKYIVPQIQLVKEITYTTPYTTYNKVNYEQILEQILNKDESFYGKNYFGNDYTTVSPFMTEKTNLFPYTNTFGGIFGENKVNKVNYKFLLEKMMNKMMLNKNIFGGETVTDVRVLPTGQIKEETVGQFVNPITGEKKITYGDIKVVDEKMIPTMMDFPVEKTDMLKKYYLNKIFNGQEIIPTINEEMMSTVYPREYQNTFNYKYNPIVSRMYGLNKYNTMNKFNKFEDLTTFGRFNKINRFNKMDLIKEELIKEELIKDELLKEQLIKGELIKDDLYKKMEYGSPMNFDLIRKMDLLKKGGLIGGEEKYINALPIEKQQELYNMLTARVPLTREEIFTKDALKMKTLEKELLNQDTIIKA
jgi:hypothetical protein